MISDHITFMKSLVEDVLVRSDGSKPFKGKFFEVYPKAATIIKTTPCAALRHMTGGAEEDGSYSDVKVKTDAVMKRRRLKKMEYPYQIDLYSSDIYDFYSDDKTDLLSQLIKAIAERINIKDSEDNIIEIEQGASGYFDDETLVIDNVYKAYCRITFIDGAYADENVARMPGAENIIIDSEVDHGQG